MFYSFIQQHTHSLNSSRPTFFNFFMLWYLN